MSTDQYQSIIIIGAGAAAFAAATKASELEQAALSQPQQIADAAKVLMESSLPQTGRPVL